MANAKKKQNSTKQRIGKRALIILSITGAVLLIAGGLLARSYLIERLTLSELSSTADELKVAYDNIRKSNEGNIVSSYFRNDCSLANVSWLEQRISCGPSGNIVLKTATGVVSAADTVSQSIKEISIGNIPNVESSQDSTGVSWKTEKSGVKCFISYSEDIVTHHWGYDLVCRKDVSNVLPGYVVEQ